MNDACNELLLGQITLDVLKILLSGKKNFISIVEEIKAFTTEFIETALCIREKELVAFTTTLTYVKEFVYVCRKIEGISSYENETKFCENNIIFKVSLYILIIPIIFSYG